MAEKEIEMVYLCVLTRSGCFLGRFMRLMSFGRWKVYSVKVKRTTYQRKVDVDIGRRKECVG